MFTIADDGKRTKKTALGLLIRVGIFLAVLGPISLYANPQGGQVVIPGSATITQAGSTTTINQSSNSAIINWQSFSIAANETTRFNQPSSSAIALNRVIGNDASQILGSLIANGKVMLINPNGILFGKGATVDVAGLIASTANISNQDFLNGNYHFVQDPTKNYGIVNNGMITARGEGLVALVAPGVENNGIIQANLGKVVLASGKEFTIVDTYGDNLISFASGSQVTQTPLYPDGTPMRDAVANHGTIIADGGTVLMTARAAAAVVDNVVNMDGVVQANSISQHGGVIILSGGDSGVVRVAGKIHSRGIDAGTKGGTVKVVGQDVGLFDGTDIDVSGDAGGGTVLIGGDAHGTSINVEGLPNAQAVYVDPTATIKADALTNGNGGKVVVWSDDSTKFYGSISAQGGSQSGNGGWVETSGHYLDVNGARINTLAPNGTVGTWLLDPTNIYIANNQADATSAGMTGTDTSADTGTGTNPTLFEASGAVQDSLLTVSNLQTALGTSDVTVSATNASGIGAGDIKVVDPVTWSSATTLTLQAGGSNSAITVYNNGPTLPTINATGGGSLTFGNAGTINLMGSITLTGGTLSGTGTTVNVGINGLVQNGVDVAAVGGTVNLDPATYDLTNEIVINKSLTLQNTTSDSAILNGQGNTRVMEIDGNLSGITVNLNNLTLENGNGVGTNNSGNGGGLLIFTENGKIATVNINNSTFSSNSALNGGGIFNDGSNGGTATLNIINSTFSSNSATQNYGGGIFNNSASGNATLDITNSTISGNTAFTLGGGIFNNGFNSSHAILIIGDTIIAGNKLKTVTNTSRDYANSNGVLQSLGYNLYGQNGQNGGFIGAVSTDIQLSGSISSVLNSLANNGGPTQTMALVSGSPALSSGGTLSNHVLPITDQRGEGRETNGVLDIGAYQEHTPITGSFDVISPTITYGTSSNVTITFTLASVAGSIPMTDLPTFTINGNAAQTLTFNSSTGVSQATYTTAATDSAGIYSVTTNFNGYGHYAAASDNALSFTISPAQLTITADNATRLINQANPVFTATYTGLVNGETSNVVTGLILETVATTTSPVGNYPIVPQNAVASNYNINYVNGTLSVTSIPVNNSINNTTLYLIPNAQLVAYTNDISGVPNNNVNKDAIILMTPDLFPPTLPAYTQSHSDKHKTKYQLGI